MTTNDIIHKDNIKPFDDKNSNDSANDNKVPPVPLNFHDIIYCKEEHWLPSYIVDQLYIQMCEKEIEDPQGRYGQKISKYYLQQQICGPDKCR